MKDNKTMYNISISNISEGLYDLLRDTPDEKALFDNTNDPNSDNLDFEQLDNLYTLNI